MARRLAQPRHSRTVLRPHTLTTTLAPVADRAARSARSQASSPGFCRPTLLSMPPPAGNSLGAGLPGHGTSRQRLDDDRPEQREVEVGPQLGAMAGRPRSGHNRVGQDNRADRRCQAQGRAFDGRHAGHGALGLADPLPRRPRAAT